MDDVQIPLSFLAKQEQARLEANLNNDQKTIAAKIHNITIIHNSILDKIEKGEAKLIAAFKDSPNILKIYLLDALINTDAKVVLSVASKVDGKDVILIPANKEEKEPLPQAEIRGLTHTDLLSLFGITKISGTAKPVDPVIYVNQGDANGKREWATCKLHITITLTVKIPKITGEVSSIPIEIDPTERFVVPPGSLGTFPLTSPSPPEGEVGLIPVFRNGTVSFINITDGKKLAIDVKTEQPPGAIVAFPNKSTVTLPAQSNFPLPPQR